MLRAILRPRARPTVFTASRLPLAMIRSPNRARPLRLSVLGLSRSCHKQLRFNSTDTKAQPVSEPTVLSSAMPCLPIGVCSGFVGSITGVGGAIVMVPLLANIAKFRQIEANGTALLSTCVTAITGALTFGASGAINVPMALGLTATAAITMRVGVKLASRLSERTMKLLFAAAFILFAPLVSLKSFLSSKDKPKDAASAATTTNAANEQAPQDVRTAILAQFDVEKLKREGPFYLALGAVVGFATGILGFGGGLLMSTTLTLATDMSQQMVFGTCLATMITPSFVGAATHYKLGNIRTRAVPMLLAGAVVGAILGSKAALGIDQDSLRLLFSAFLLFNGVRTLGQVLAAKKTAQFAAAKAAAAQGKP